MSLSAVQIGEVLLEGAEDAEGTVEANRALLYRLRRELLRDAGFAPAPPWQSGKRAVRKAARCRACEVGLATPNALHCN